MILQHFATVAIATISLCQIISLVSKMHLLQCYQKICVFSIRIAILTKLSILTLISYSLCMVPARSQCIYFRPKSRHELTVAPKVNVFISDLNTNMSQQMLLKMTNDRNSHMLDSKEKCQCQLSISCLCREARMLIVLARVFI